jgi:hypothetical protein
MRVRRTSGDGGLLSYAFVAGGIVAGLLYTANIAPVVDLAAFGVVGLSSAVALAIGPWWRGAQPYAPWALLSAASVSFLIGALVRPVVSDLHGPVSLLADAFTLPGNV